MGKTVEQKLSGDIQKAVNTYLHTHIPTYAHVYAYIDKCGLHRYT